MSKKQIVFSSLVCLLLLISTLIYIYFNQPTKLEVSTNIIDKIDIVTKTLNSIDNTNIEDLGPKLKIQLKDLKKVLIQADNIGYPSEDEILELTKALEEIDSKSQILLNLIFSFTKSEFYNDKEYKILKDFQLILSPAIN